MFRQMMGLAEQVGEAEAQVEGRVAEVDHLMIQQHQSLMMNENVLGAVIAMHQGQAAGAGFFNQGMEEIGRRRNLAGGVAVVRLQPQRLQRPQVPVNLSKSKPSGGRSGLIAADVLFSQYSLAGKGSEPCSLRLKKSLQSNQLPSGSDLGWMGLDYWAGDKLPVKF